MSGSATSNIAQSLGIVSLIWGGQKYSVDAKSSSFSTGGLVAKTVVNGNQISVSQELMPSMVKASFALLKGMSLNTLKGLNGTELQVKCDTGQTYTVPSAYLTKDPAVKGGAGNNVSCEWGGEPAVESFA